MSDEFVSWSCTDCKHHSYQYVTTCPSTVSPAYGGARVSCCVRETDFKQVPVRAMCSDMRMFGGACGPSARLFEAK